MAMSALSHIAPKGYVPSAVAAGYHQPCASVNYVAHAKMNMRNSYGISVGYLDIA